ncbi:MAG: hypothetical protein FWE07_06895 [Turicibacter sp.]|nr:hypothetical protein [Turicibacter sp.]
MKHTQEQCLAIEATWIQGVVYLLEDALYRGSFDHVTPEHLLDYINNEWLRRQADFTAFPTSLALVDFHFSPPIAGPPPVRDWTYPLDPSRVEEPIDLSLFFPTANAFAFKNAEEQIVVGIAGTNLRNRSQTLDDISTNTDMLVSGGISELYLRGVNNWLTDLGNVHLFTGHSLGGACAAILGMMHDVPSLVFNPSAVSGLWSSNWLTAIVENATTQPILFVTHDDFLQGNGPFGTLFHLLAPIFIGSLFVVPHGTGHANANFRLTSNQTFISEVWDEFEAAQNNAATLRIQFSRGEFTIPTRFRLPRNPFAGIRIQIDVAAFQEISHRLLQLNNESFEAIKQLSQLSYQRNEGVAADRTNRLTRLVDQTFNKLINSGYDKLHDAFPRSYGRSELNSGVWYRLKQASLPSDFISRFITRHPDTDGSTIWLFEGVAWSRQRLSHAFLNVQQAVQTLDKEVDQNPLENHVAPSSFSFFPLKSSAPPSQIYAGNFNALVAHIRDVLRGYGNHRSTLLTDAISQTIKDVLATMKHNIGTGSLKGAELATNALMMAMNAQKLDQELAFRFYTASHIDTSAASSNTLIASERHPLKKATRLAESESITSARQAQAELRHRDLMQSITHRIQPLNDTLINHCQRILTRCDDLQRTLFHWHALTHHHVTSVDSETTTPQIRLPLSHYIPKDILGDIETINSQITLWVEAFETTLKHAIAFRNSLTGISQGLLTDIQEALYSHSELTSKKNAVMAIIQILNTLATSYDELANSIKQAMNGRTIQTFALELKATADHLRKVMSTLKAQFDI